VTYRKLNGDTSLLRIYLGDFDKYQHQDLYRLIVEKARESGLAGCTVFRGFWGYGVRGFIHSDIILEGAGEQPILIEIVDSQERVRGFVGCVIPMLSKAGGLITEETVYVHHYQHAVQDQHVMQDQHAAQEFQCGLEKNSLNLEGSAMSRELNRQQILLRIFIGELDKVGHKPLFEAILERSRELGVAGCTVIKGIMGFGASSVIHQDHLFRLSQDSPILLEVVDFREKIHALLDQIRPMLQGALVTEEKVVVHHYTPNAPRSKNEAA